MLLPLLLSLPSGALGFMGLAPPRPTSPFYTRPPSPCPALFPLTNVRFIFSNPGANTGFPCSLYRETETIPPVKPPCRPLPPLPPSACPHLQPPAQKEKQRLFLLTEQRVQITPPLGNRFGYWGQLVIVCAYARVRKQAKSPVSTCSRLPPPCRSAPR